MDEEKTLLPEEDVVTEAPPADTQPDIEAPEDDAAAEGSADEMTELITLPEEFSEEQTEPAAKKRRPSKKAILTAAISVAAVVVIAVSGVLIRNAVISKQAVDSVIASIDSIGTVSNSDESRSLIENAIIGFNSLSEKQKPKVTNYNTLISAQNTYNALVQLDEYRSTLVEAVSDIRSNVSLYITDALDETQTVWHNAIWKEYDEYNKGDYSDFNNALMALYFSADHLSRLQSIRTLNDSISESITELQNPPSQYKAAYDAFTKLYGAYLPLYDESLNPTGSYNSFTSKINTLITNYNTADAEMKAVLPIETQ